MGDAAGCSTDVLQEIRNLNARIAERTFEGETIHLIVERKNDAPSIRVLHFDVAALAVDLREPCTLQRCQNLPTGEQRPLYRVSATTS